MNTSFKYNEASWSVLALLRFALAVIVLASHLNLYFFRNSLPPLLNLLNSCGGKAAVLSFLFISGLSIGHSYSKQQKGFYKRRFLRIYPLYFAAIAFTVILQYTIGSSYHVPAVTFVPAGMFTSIGNLFFLQGIIAITITYNAPLWSLSVEVFYYVLTPVLYRIKPMALIFFVGVSMLVFFFFYMKWPSFWGVPMVKYLGFWLTGFLFAANKVKTWMTMFLFLLSAYLAHDVLWINNLHEGNLSGVTVFVTATVIIVLNNQSLKMLFFLQRAFNYLGEVSYPLYLFHMPLLLFFYRYFNATTPYILTTLVMLSIIPINYFFDNVLKKIFWKPLVSKAGEIFNKATPKIKMPGLQKLLVRVRN